MFKKLTEQSALVIALFGFVGIVLIFILGFFAVPIILIALIATSIHWYKTKGPDTAALREAANVGPNRGFPSETDFIEGHVARLLEAHGETVPAINILRQFAKIARELYVAEDLVNPVPPLPPSGVIEEGRYRDRMLARMRKLANPDETLLLFNNTLSTFFLGFTDALPPTAQQGGQDGESLATISLIQLVPSVPEAVQSIYDTFGAPALIEAGLFHDLRKQLILNCENVSGGKSKLVLPESSKLPPEELIAAYLAHTPLRFLFDVQIPFNLETKYRYEHTAIVAGPGHGKTQLLQWLILQDLYREDPPSLIVLDSTGQMVDRIQRLALFSERLRDRLIIIDPAHAPALNMFDISTVRLDRYTAEQREDVQGEILSLFNYVFASGDYDLTARMGTAFTYAVKLIMSKPGSTITELRQLLEEDLKGKSYAASAFKPDIDKLDADAQDFFKNHFFSPSLAGTRLNIAQRLHKVIGIPAFRRMFTSGTNALDFFEDMQRGAIILVNTNQQLLKEDAYILFGRYIIARALAAAFERATIKAEERKEAYLIIDEASPYFDEKFEILLTRARQFKLGVVIAFQHLEQATGKLQSAIASSTSIKFGGAVGFNDRRWLAREMETTPDFINAQKKDPADRFTRFATFVRNYTPHAVSLTVPIGLLEKQPRMTDEVYEAMLAANLKRVAPAPPDEPPPPQDAPTSPPPPQAPPPPVAPVAPIASDDELPTSWGNATIKPSE